jgi:EAL domain-containing protein (putative c-di-GMP-specific phosphodiesterase class I)/GGDEF domain-containing protein
LRAALGNAAGPGQLMLIGIDGYTQHCRRLGTSAATRLLDELAGFIAKSNAWREPLLRVADAVFARILPRVDSEGAADSARLAVDSVAGHIHAVGSQSVTCAITIAICPLDAAAKGVDALVDRAWLALLEASDRSAGLRPADPARVEVVHEQVAAPATTARAAGNLPDAVKQQLFRILYQPMVSLRGDTSEYYEVQVAHTPSGKNAAAWIADTANAEASLELDKWTVIESLKQLSVHRRRHPATRLILPVGAGAVLEAEFANWLGMALRAAELPADCLAIQISHRAVSSSLRQAKQLAERLQAIGCALSVCDVHSANNPIADLAHLKPQFARIDPTLAQALKDADVTNTLLKPLVESLHQEQIASIMPNVEGAGVLAVLWQLGVNYIQGDYLQRPAPEMHYDFTDLA